MRRVNFHLDGCCSALVLYTSWSQFACAQKLWSREKEKDRKNIPRVVVRTCAVQVGQADNINVLKRVTGVRERKEQKEYTQWQSGCVLAPRRRLTANLFN